MGLFSVMMETSLMGMDVVPNAQLNQGGHALQETNTQPVSAGTFKTLNLPLPSLILKTKSISNSVSRFTFKTL